MTETPNPHIIDADTLTGEMRPIRRAVLALGSNLGERLATLQGAVDAIADTPDVWVTAVSPVYETEPVDAPEGSETFLNAVLLVDTTLAAHRLLDRALAVEDAFDRERSEIRNAPRTLDIDLIVVGDRRSDDELKLPHPRAGERAFVLQPWHDVEPDAELPDGGPDRRAPGRARRLGPHPPRRPGARDPVSERPSGDEQPPDGHLEPTGVAVVAGSVMVGLVGGWLLHPVSDRFGNPPGRQLAPAARVVLRGGDPRRHGVRHPSHAPRPPRVDRAAPRRQPAGAGPRVRRRGRPGDRRLPRVRRQLARCPGRAGGTNGSSARPSPASRARESSSERSSSNARVASVPTTRGLTSALCLPRLHVGDSAAPG